MPPSGSDELYDVLEEFLVRLLNMGECDSMDTLVDTDLSFTQARLLFALARHGDPVPIHEVATELRLSVASTGRNVDQLVSQGLVVRREDEHDRRVRRVTLSDSGRAQAQKHVDAKRQGLRAFVRRLPVDQRDQLLASLRQILAGDSLQSHSLGGNS